MKSILKQALIESIKTKRDLQNEQFIDIFELIGNLLVKCIINQGKILLCGNGGSAADAQHLAAELLVRLRPEFNRDPIPAIALAMDTSTLTACGNDFGYKNLFERNILALGRKQDVLILISTSGMSENLELAALAAKKIGIITLGLLGKDGGSLRRYCDHSIIIPSYSTARIQECHITIGHALMEFLEEKLLKIGHIKKL